MAFSFWQHLTRGKKILAGLAAAGVIASAGVYAAVSSLSFMEYAASQAQTIATQTLDTRVEVGLVQVEGISSIRIKDLAVYDKQDGIIASSQDTVVDFSLLSMLKASPVEGVKDITLTGVKGRLFQRADGTWNVEDLISQQATQTNFTSRVHVKDAELDAEYKGQAIYVNNINTSLDFATYPTAKNIRIEGSAENEGALAKVKADVGGDRQTFDVEADNIYIEKYLRFVPEGTIPADRVKDISGQVKHVAVAGEMVGQDLYYTGQVELENGRATILDKQVEDINGLLVVNEKFAQVFLNAKAYGQTAYAHGKIQLDTGTPLLNITAEVKDFAPNKLYTDIDYSGPVTAAISINGTADNPTAEGTVSIKAGSLSGYDFSNASARIYYENSVLLAKDLKLNIFGGTVTGEVEFDASDYAYLGHLKADRIDVGSALATLDDAPAVGGLVSGDVDIYGQGAELDVNSLQALGSVTASGLSYEDMSISSARSYFFKDGRKLTLDYCLFTLNNGGIFGVEGDIVLGDSLDCAIYAKEFDLSLVEAYLKNIDMSGRLDFSGTVKGPIDNPVLRAEYAGVNGSIYHQPFDRLHGTVAGSLQGMKIDDFIMEHGDTRWYINDGMLGFQGDMGIKLRVDTVGARMEDLIKVMDWDQKITGNVDNVITITGTLKNPNVDGYVHMTQGSYEGVFVTGMDGDYKLKNGTIDLQDFHVYSPWMDMDLNGTIDPHENINLKVAAHEFSLERIAQLAGDYPITGRARFDGTASGTLDRPLFDGQLEASDIQLNGVDVSNVNGRVAYSNNTMSISNVGFSQNGGDYRFNASLNMKDYALGGSISISNADLSGLLSIANFKDNRIGGRINGTIGLGGTINNPHITCETTITTGNFGQYPFRNVLISGEYGNRKIQINEISGNEGTDGKLLISGYADLDGDMNATATMTGVDVGAITEAFNIGLKTSGTANLQITANGQTQNPDAEASLEVIGAGIENNRLDSITGRFKLHDRVIYIEPLVSTKNVNKKDYHLTLSGAMPLAAFTDEGVTESNQFDLRLVMDKADLSLLPYLWKGIDWGLGETGGQVHITGIAKRPYINGYFELKKGALKLKELGKPITDMDVRFFFRDNTVTIERFAGKLGNGSYTGKGFLSFDGLKPTEFNLDFDAKELDIDCDFYKGPLTTSLKIEDTNLSDEDVDTYVSGRMFLDNCVISIPSLPGSSSDLPEVMLNYDVELGKNVRFISPYVGDMQLAGSVHFGGDSLNLKNSGKIYVKKGTLSYLKTSFKITDGELKFDVPESLYPRLLLHAYTKISTTSVFVSLDGPVTNMQFKLSSSPAMSQSEILMLLTFRTNYKDGMSGEEQIGSMMSLGLQMALLGQVETSMRNFLNLDEFTVERDSTTGYTQSSSGKKGEEIYNLKLGKNIDDKNILKFQKSLNTNDMEYGFDHEFNNRFSAGFRLDENGKPLAGFHYRVTF